MYSFKGKNPKEIIKSPFSPILIFQTKSYTYTTPPSMFNILSSLLDHNYIRIFICKIAVKKLLEIYKIEGGVAFQIKYIFLENYYL